MVEDTTRPSANRSHVVSRAILFEEFAGRAEEFDFLVDFRTRAGREARGGTIVLSGDAGVGKSRLLHEYAQLGSRERGAVLRVACDREQARPYGPFVEALERLKAMREVRGLASIDSALAALTTAHAVTVEDAGEQVQQRIAALRSAFEEAAKRLTQLSLVVDDLHASDLATLEALRGLTSSAKRAPLVLVLAYRLDDVALDLQRSRAIALLEREAAGRISLGSLPEQILTRSLRALLPVASTQTIDRICELSEGKPFVAEELARSVVEHGESARLAPTLSLRSAVLGRVAKLDEASRETIRHAAVLGKVVSIDDMVADGKPLADLVRTLRIARDLQLIEERQEDGEASFRFRHAITREILYADCLAVERAAIHRTAARRLERDHPERLAEIAYHLGASGASERACEASDRAGDRALEIAAYADAVEWYVRAFEGTVDSRADDLFRVARKFLRALDGAGGLEGRFEFVERLFDRLEATGRLVDVYEVHIGALKIFATYESSRTARLLSRVAADAPEGTTESVRFDAAIALFHAYVLGHRFEHAARALERARELSRSPTPLQRSRMLVARTILAFHWQGDRALAESLVLQSRDLAREMGNGRGYANALKNLSAIAAERGEFRECLRLLSEAGVAFLKAGFLRSAAKADGVAAMYATLIGEYATAKRLLAGTPYEARREREWLVTRALMLRTIGSSERRERSELESALNEAIARNDAIFVGHLAADLAWSASDYEESRKMVKAALVTMPRLETDLDMAYAVAVFGDATDVAAIREVVRDLALDERDVLKRAGRLLVEARIAERENRTLEAKQRAREAEAFYRTMGLWSGLAQALVLQGRTAEARQLLADVGATAELARLEDAPGVDFRAPALSQREEQVARLAATGLSTREIGDELAISPRTVETHLGKIFEKLMLGSRLELKRYFEKE